MIFNKISPDLNKLYEATGAMKNWIEKNKPTQVESETVYQDFMNKWGSNLTGSEEFITTTKKVIQEASQLATGITIMRRLLKDGKADMRIVEGESQFESDQEDKSTPKSCSISLGFCKPEHFYVCLNANSERSLYLSPRIKTFIHESLHAWHHFTGVKPTNEPLLPDMDNSREELVITGNLHKENADYKDFCCDCTTLLELGKPFRINHRGLWQDNLNFYDFVLYRIFEKIREQIESGSISNEKKEGLTPLEVAMHYFCKETDLSAQEEWLQLIAMLTEAGGLTEHSFRLAVLQNSKELIELMLKAGAQVTDELLNEANKEVDERITLIWNKLEEHNTVISNAKIEEMCKQAYISKPGQESPVFLKMDEQSKQYKAVKSKVVDDGTLPIHTIQRLFFNNQFQNRDGFLDWVESHSIRPIRKPKPVEPQSPVKQDVQNSHVETNNQNDPVDPIVFAAPQENENGAFEITSDGTCHLSAKYHGCYPQCYKAHSYQIGVDVLPDSYFFTPQERENFLHALRPRDFNLLAGSMAHDIMRSLSIGYMIESQNGAMLEVDRDVGLYRILEDAIEKTIMAAFSHPSFLSSITTPLFRDHAYFLDINLLSTDGSGLLQKNSSYNNGKYRDVIANLIDKHGNPVHSATCRLALEDHLNFTSFALNFRSSIIVNGETEKELVYG